MGTGLLPSPASTHEGMLTAWRGVAWALSCCLEFVFKRNTQGALGISVSLILVLLFFFFLVKIFLFHI